MGSRGSPALQRAALSSRMADTTFRNISEASMSRIVYSGSPSIVVDRRQLDRLDDGQIVARQILGLLVAVELERPEPARLGHGLDVAGADGPRRRPRASRTAAAARMIGATCSGVTKRGVFSTKMKPRASAPASTATFASSGLVMPQILILTTQPQLPNFRPHVRRPHQPLAHQHRVGAGRHHAPHVRRR